MTLIVQCVKEPKKSRFSKEEDKILKEVVLENGACAWGKIAKNLPGRSARQCRDRWVNYLNPELTDKGWTKAEDDLLLDMYNEFGTHWKDISTFFDGRSLNSIRNRVFKLVRKKVTKPNKKTNKMESENEKGVISKADENALSDDVFDFKCFEKEFINDAGQFGYNEEWMIPTS